jgi:hypothetical protein
VQPEGLDKLKNIHLPHFLNFVFIFGTIPLSFIVDSLQIFGEDLFLACPPLPLQVRRPCSIQIACSSQYQPFHSS